MLKSLVTGFVPISALLQPEALFDLLAKLFFFVNLPDGFSSCNSEGDGHRESVSGTFLQGILQRGIFQTGIF